MNWIRPVLSDMVSEIGWEEEPPAMIVVWKKSGKTSAYAGVPEELAERVSKAWSVGSMIISDIKPNFPHRYV